VSEVGAVRKGLSLWQRAEVEPDRIAVVEPDGSTVTFAEFARDTRRISRVLQAHGACRADHLCSMLPNGSRALEVIAAAWECGLHYTPLNFRLPGTEIAYVLGDCGATFFVADARFDAIAQDALDGTTRDLVSLSVGSIDGFEPLDAAMEEAGDGPLEARTVGARMYYTSGTTGRPKGVQRELPDAGADVDEASLAHAHGLFSNFGLDLEGYGAFLECGPLYHPSPMGFAIAALNLGKTVVMTEGFDAEHVLGLIERWRCDSSHMVPTMFVRLLKLPDDVRRRYDVSSMCSVVHAAAPCPVDVKRRMIEWLGPVVHEYYSSTEGVGGTRVTAQEWLDHPGTVGRVEPGTLVVMDDAGNVLGPSEVGKVYSKTGFVYHNDPEKTAATRHGEYATVGDIGFLDDDGYLYLVDRIADVINSGGVNIYPAEIEHHLVRHPGVADVAVIGVPNDEYGEEVKAVVQLAVGWEPSEELAAELLNSCRAVAPSYRCPRSVDFVEALPRDDNGKLYRRRVRDPYWAGRERRI
jgi:long-chain acyl-CoA synthetase